MKPPLRLLAPHPTVCCSSTVASNPSRASVLAADRPVYPPPMITTSLEAGSGDAGMEKGGAVSTQRQRSNIGAQLYLAVMLLHRAPLHPGGPRPSEPAGQPHR